MSGLLHQFFLLPATEWQSQRGFRHMYAQAGGVKIHDDLLQYMRDSLLWIPTYNPAKNMRRQMGFNMCGLTTVKSDGAHIGLRIFRAWADVFRCGPEALVLTGAFVIGPGSAGDGAYEKLTIDRDETVLTLNHLVQYAEEVVQSADGRWILHIGI